MEVPALSLREQYETIRAPLEAAVAEVFESQLFILGPKVAQCEEAIADYCRCAHAVGVSSGTDALLICLMAEGIGPGDEVITTPYTFFATAGAIVRVGARPVFVDIDPTTYNLDPELLSAAVTPRTRAIMPVHLFGQMADMDPIMEVAAQQGLTVIEDAAQAIGAEYNARRAGSVGHYGCLSFFPSKNLGGAGDGGMVVTNDRGRAEKLAVLRVHGAEPKYHHACIGGNFRLDALQAAVVNVKVHHLDTWTAARQAGAARYDRLLGESGLVQDGTVALPRVHASRHVFNQYVIRVPERDELAAFLKDEGIGARVYYPVPLHLQECLRYLGYTDGSLPESERAARETLALPIYPELTDEQAHYVVDRICAFFAA
ncbi:MAG: transcriptional regulator [Planctomycetes bacterium SM23_32]|nr:MAG: transcriptional regulator [Planctomycetes bacterium SM23_32]